MNLAKTLAKGIYTKRQITPISKWNRAFPTLSEILFGAIENYLYDHEADLMDISKQDVEEILLAYKANISYSEFEDGTIRLLRIYLDYQLDYGSVDRDVLLHLTDCLHLPLSRGKGVIKFHVAEYYRTMGPYWIAGMGEVNAIIERLAQEETRLGVETEQIEGLRRDVMTKYLSDAVEKYDPSRPVSPEENRHFEETCKIFGVALPLEESLQRKWNRCRLLWAIENDQLEPMTGDIHLPHGEALYGVFGFHYAKEYEVVRRPSNASFQGIGVPVGGGFTYQVGGMSQGTEQVELLCHEGDVGYFYVTNQRFIFLGYDTVQVISFEEVLRVTRQYDSLRIYTSSREIPLEVYIKDGDAELAERLVEDVLNRAKGSS